MLVCLSEDGYPKDWLLTKPHTKGWYLASICGNIRGHNLMISKLKQTGRILIPKKMVCKWDIFCKIYHYILVAFMDIIWVKYGNEGLKNYRT